MYEAIKLCTKEKYKVFKQRLLKIFLAFCKSPTFFETLFSTTEMSFFYERCSLSKIPRNSIEVVRSMTFPLIANIGSFKRMLSFWRNLWKNVYFVFPLFNVSLLALNQTAILLSSRFTLLIRLICYYEIKKDLYCRQILLTVEY